MYLYVGMNAAAADTVACYQMEVWEALLDAMERGDHAEIQRITLNTRPTMLPKASLRTLPPKPAASLSEIARGEGDLSRRLKVGGRDEIGSTAGTFNQMMSTIAGLVKQVSESAAAVNGSAHGLSESAGRLAESSRRQNEQSVSAAAAVDEMLGNITHIASSTEDVRERSRDSLARSQEGQRSLAQLVGEVTEVQQAVHHMADSVGEFVESTKAITNMTREVREIAEQTNLLALNAAIEAARAGEQGRGFAVVADEVRNLAHRTQSSAQEIQQMIEQLQVGAGASVQTMTESQRQSESSVSIADRAGERLGEVTQRIGEIDGMNQSVATATEEQTAVIESLNMDITEINTLNQQGVENLQSTLRACGDLDQQARRLKQLVDSFRI